MMISWEIAPSSFDELRLHIERFPHVASIYANLLEQKKKHLHEKRVQLPDDLLGTVSLFSNTNMAAVTPCENALYISGVLSRDLQTKEVY